MRRITIIPKGTKFGKWVVLSDDIVDEKGLRRILCKCECGKKRMVIKTSLMQGKSKKCGDVHKSGDLLYWVCHAMAQRCQNKNNKAYKYYGARGIKFNFKNPLEAVYWIENNLGKKPSDNHSVDRENNDGHYEPGNLIWATKKQQALNRRKRNGCSSKYKGISFSKENNKWSSRIIVNSKEHWIGYFKTIVPVNLRGLKSPRKLLRK